MKCPYCGKEVGDVKFCPECGTALYNLDVVQNVQATAKPVSHEKEKKPKKKLGCGCLTVVVAFFFVMVIGSFSTGSTSTSHQSVSTTKPDPSASVKSSLSSDPDLTMGQKNALNTAKNYLNAIPLSYTGMIKQLEFEGYSTEDAVFAANNCGADWNEQAAKCAANYLRSMSFSRSGLIEQLEYEGFTTSQAEYGVSAVGY